MLELLAINSLNYSEPPVASWVLQSPPVSVPFTYHPMLSVQAEESKPPTRHFDMPIYCTGLFWSFFKTYPKGIKMVGHPTTSICWIINYHLLSKYLQLCASVQVDELRRNMSCLGLGAGIQLPGMLQLSACRTEYWFLKQVLTTLGVSIGMYPPGFAPQPMGMPQTHTGIPQSHTGMPQSVIPSVIPFRDDS